MFSTLCDNNCGSDLYFVQLRGSVGDAGEEDFKHIVMAAHDGFVEAKTMAVMMTQTDDKDFLLLEEESGEVSNNEATAGSSKEQPFPGEAGGAETGVGVELTTFGKVIMDEHSVHSTGEASQSSKQTAPRKIVTSDGQNFKVFTARNRRASIRGYTAVEDSAANTTSEEAENPMWGSSKDNNWIGYLKENL